MYKRPSMSVSCGPMLIKSISGSFQIKSANDPVVLGRDRIKRFCFWLPVRNRSTGLVFIA